MFQEYRRKPIVVKAVKWLDPENPPDGIWDVRKSWKQCCPDKTEYFGKVTTLNGTVRINLGEYLVIGTQAELYPCEAEIFENIHAPNGDFEFEAPLVKSFDVDRSINI